jgi:hypothetical protein
VLPLQSQSTASVSYVVASESTQDHIRDRYEPLPHVTIRPVGLLNLPGPQVAAVADMMQGQVGWLRLSPGGLPPGLVTG